MTEITLDSFKTTNRDSLLIKYPDKITDTKTCKDNASFKKDMEKLERLIRYELEHSQDKPNSEQESGKACLAMIKIIGNTEDFRTCSLATELLYKLLYKTRCAPDAIRLLAAPQNYSKIFETLQLVHLNHYKNSQKTGTLVGLHLKLLKILECLHNKRPRSQYSCISNDSIRYIGLLMFAYRDSKEHAEILLNISRNICKTKKYCQILGTSTFFDALYFVTMLMQETDTAMRIIKCMYKYPHVLDKMKHSDHFLQFISALINSNNGTRAMKRHMVAVLYKLGKKVPEKLKTPAVWRNLLEFFQSNEKLDDKHLHMSVIKIYTLLNLASTQKIIPTSALNYKQSLPHQTYKEKSAQYFNFNESENDNEDTEEEDEDEELKERKSFSEEAESDDNSDEESNSYSEIFAEINNSITGKEDIEFMKPYFLELLSDNTDTNDRTNDSKNVHWINSFLSKEIVKPKYIKYKAYPDIVNAEADYQDDSLINSSICQFDVPRLIKRLKTINSVSKYGDSEVIYNLDALIKFENKDTCNVPSLSQTVLNPEIENHYIFKEFPRPGSHNQYDLHNVNDTSKHKHCLQFESRFESGNLRYVERFDDYEYNLFLTPDTCTCRGRQWFYFQVSNMDANVPYTFNIVNFDKINSQFNYGMQPVMFSTRDYILNGCGWRRAGGKIIYYGNNYTNEEKSKQYRTLSFSVTFDYDNDKCYFAYHYPYTYTRLMSRLFSYTNVDDSQIYARVDNLCHTANNNNVPIVTITASFDNLQSLKIPLDKRPIVFLTARVHPGESNSSWIMDGILKFLLDTKNEKAILAREHYIFKIIPMLNPEGVIFGNTRSGLNGCDLNRCWKNPDENVHPEIYYSKKLIEFARKRLSNPIAAFVDIHGHSRKKYYFFYGCNPLLSWNKNDKTSADTYTTHQVIPEELCFDENMKSLFCQYKIEKKKESTCRVVMWREFGIKGSLTLECSYSSGENKKKMTTPILQNIGQNLIIALANLATRVSSDNEILPGS